jgi:hypothetical protein
VQFVSILPHDFDFLFLPPARACARASMCTCKCILCACAVVRAFGCTYAFMRMRIFHACVFICT